MMEINAFDVFIRRLYNNFGGIMQATAKLICVVFLSSFVLTQSGVEVVKLEQLQSKVVKKENDTLYVVNFWATWCAPCVKELPYFRAADDKFAGKKVKVIFISLNSLKELPIVEKFVADKKIKQEVLLLNESNPNLWLDKVDSTWDGSIPATAMYKNGRKVFFKESEFTQTEIDSVIQLKNK